ncbi:AbiH family protein [Lachnospiraceae bacterium 48-21]
MNILIIGNGFDLAHDLPTQYVLFLNYTKVCASYGKINNQIKKKEKEKVRGVDQSLINHFAYLISCKKERFDEISALVENNIWLKHFDRIQTGEGWIDFESEISRIVQVFEDARKTIVNEITSGKRRGRMTQGQFSVLSSFIESDSSDRGINSLYNLFHKSEF